MTLRISELVSTYRRNGLGFHQSAFETDILAELDSRPGAVEREFLTSRERISRDGRLTAEGKKDALREAGRAAAKKLREWLDPRVTNITKAENERIERLRVAATPAPVTDTAARIEAAMLRAEIRRQAGTLSPEVVEQLYRDGGAMVRAALEELPRIVTTDGGFTRVEPFVPTALREQVIIDEGSRLEPDVANELHDLRTAREVLTTATAQLVRAIETEAPGAIEHPIVVLP